MESLPPFTLESFLGDLDRAAFMREVWPSGFHVSRAPPDRFAALDEIEALFDPGALAEHHAGEIFVLGPNHLRATTTAADAAEFYRIGCTLYFIDVHASIPELTPLRDQLAESLGCALEDISCELFAARGGAHSSLHFDHEYNFHVVLAGTKRWRLARNQAVCAPLSGYVAGASQSGTADVHLYKDGPLLDQLGADADLEIELSAGDAVFFSRGVWHEVDALDDALSINFAVHPPAWWELIVDALKLKLQCSPAMREFVFGVDTAAGPSAESRAAFDELVRPALLEAVRGLDADAVLFSQPARYARAPGVSATVDDAGLIQLQAADWIEELEVEPRHRELVRRAIDADGAFSVATLQAQLPDCSCEEVRLVLDGLTEAGLFIKSA